jgi:hypothetical protein
MALSRTTVERQNGNWRPWKLKLRCTFAVLLCEVAVFVGIVVLVVLSWKNDGFVHVLDKPLGTIAGHPIQRQILWTSLPTLLMVLLSLAYTMIVGSAAELQPYVELVDNKTKHRNARLTIMLDYPSYPPLYNWIVAFGNRHFHLGGAMLVHFLCSFSLTPLTSSLFQAAVTTNPNGLGLTSAKEARFSALSVYTNLQLAIDLSTAIHVYGANSPLWMTTKYSLDPFSPSMNEEVGNITASTSAYYVETRCKSIDVTPTGGVGYNISEGFITLQFEDRGCDVSNQSFVVSSGRDSYSYTWYQRCSDIDLDPLDRIGVYAAVYSPTSPHQLANVTVISCFPQYMNATANLTMSFDGIMPKGFDSIVAERDPHHLRFQNFRTMHATLPDYTISGFSHALNADTFGNAVHAYAQKLSPHSEFRPTVYREAMETIYSTLFAGVTHIELTKPRQQVRSFDGTMVTATTKLYVLVPIAAALAGLLSFMIACTVVLIVYVERCSTILMEEPIGLLGRALVLLRSQVMKAAADLQDRHPPGQLIDQVKQNYTVKDSRCWYEGDSHAGTGKIRVEGLHQICQGYVPGPWWRKVLAMIFGRKQDGTGLAENQDVTESKSQVVPVKGGGDSMQDSSRTAGEQQSMGDNSHPVRNDTGEDTDQDISRPEGRLGSRAEVFQKGDEKRGQRPNRIERRHTQ